MDLPDDLRALFDAEVVSTDDGYRLEVPASEVEAGNVALGEVYQVALLDPGGAGPGRHRSDEPPPDHPQPPVERGEIRYVEVEDLGKQGDGIARVERGYVIIVPGADVGERVKIEVTDVEPNYAVGEIIDESFD